MTLPLLERCMERLPAGAYLQRLSSGYAVRWFAGTALGWKVAKANTPGAALSAALEANGYKLCGFCDAILSADDPMDYCESCEVEA